MSTSIRSCHKELKVLDYFPYSPICASSCARFSVINATDGQLKALADIGPEIEQRPHDFCLCHWSGYKLFS